MNYLKKLTIVMVTLAALALVTGTAFANLITNGNFEAGKTGFASDYLYFAEPLLPATSYGPGYPGPVGYTKASLYDEGTYGVGDHPSDYHGFWSKFGDHTTGDGLMMIVNGSTISPTQANPEEVWISGSYSVTPLTTYYFSAWMASVYPELNKPPIAPATLAFSINNVQIGADFTLSAPVGTWELFFTPWTPAAGVTTANLSLLNRNLIASGNDFALDDISLDARNPVPEPATMLLLGLGLVGLAGVSRRFRK